MTETLVATFVTLFVAIEPLSTAAVFASLVADAAPSERRRTAVRGVVISAVVLFAFAFGGKPLEELNVMIIERDDARYGQASLVDVRGKPLRRL